METTRNYALGTSLTTRAPWGVIVHCRALCPDGKTRACSRIATTADTFFSVPASVTFRGKTIAGYVSTETVSGSSVETADDPAVIRFRPYLYRKNAGAFGAPRAPWLSESMRESAEHAERMRAMSERIAGNMVALGLIAPDAETRGAE